MIYEVKLLLDNNTEQLIGKYSQEKDCYLAMTAFLMSRGYKKESILYNSHSCDEYKSINSIDDYHFRIYERQKES